jgi:hypothetical protein
MPETGKSAKDVRTHATKINQIQGYNRVLKSKRVPRIVVKTAARVSEILDDSAVH